MQAEPSDFNHDIFISYRHNDNKPPGGKDGEGWVTEFVGHLTTELETMIKEKVYSIFLGKNPIMRRIVSSKSWFQKVFGNGLRPVPQHRFS